MERILYSANIGSFEDGGKEFSFKHGEDTVSLLYTDVDCIKLESNMSAKNGAYVLMTVDAGDITIKLDSEHEEFFNLLFDILCVELDVNMEEVFNISVANTKTEKTVYIKK